MYDIDGNYVLVDEEGESTSADHYQTADTVCSPASETARTASTMEEVSRTVNNLLESYSSRSAAELIGHLTLDFEYRLLPSTLGVSPMKRYAFSKHAEKVFSLFKKFRMLPTQIILGKSQLMPAHDGTTETNLVAAVHAHMEGTFIKGTVPPASQHRKPGERLEEPSNTEWRNECILTIHLSEDGSKVARIEEFVDSVRAEQMRTREECRTLNIPDEPM
ncbi:hypothetical protein VTK73DRAFT_6527 [Phialemonium thermophilum]|uniref:Uncharacterized protein n=1 Tax=Phialemonium thermophilum TaxID=223376 RepID=A0ABR3XVB2_9PEZI